MRQNEPNIYIGEKKMRSYGGYGQRSRSARAATWCGPRERRTPHPLHTRIQTTENHVCALTTETHIHKPRAPDSNNTILFSIYYICYFYYFFHISIFYFLVDALRNSPVVLDPVRSATDHVIDAFQYDIDECYYLFGISSQTKQINKKKNNKKKEKTKQKNSFFIFLLYE